MLKRSGRFAVRCIYIIIALIPFLPLCLVGQEEPSLAVTVIAVTDFAHEKDSDANIKLSQEIDNAAERVRDFFQTNYKVPARVLKAHDDTTYSELRYFLFDDLPSDTRRVQIIFVISHGVEQTYYNSPANSELFIATSDTDPQKVVSTALRGGDLLQGISHLQNGTSTFLFLDTCESAAIGSFAAKLATLFNAVTSSSRTMVLASSLDDQFSYKARFTEALINVWRSPVAGKCSATRKEMASTLANAIRQLDPLSPASAQDVSLAIPYDIDANFCVEWFSTGGALLIIRNPSHNSLFVGFSPDDTDQGVTEIHDGVIPIPLSRSSYKMIISRNRDLSVVDDRISETSLDFTKDFVRTLDVADGLTNHDPEALASTDKETADLLESWGPGASEAIVELRQRAQSEYTEAMQQNDQKLQSLAERLTQSQQMIADAKLEVQADLDGAKVAASDLAKKSGSGTAIGSNEAEVSIAGIANQREDISESSRKANSAQAKLDQSLGKLSYAEGIASSQETAITKLREKDVNDRRESNKNLTSLVNSRLLQDSKKQISEIVRANLSSLGSFQQTTRGTMLQISGDDALKPAEIRKLADFLDQNAAITMELEYVIAGNTRSSAEYQSTAEKKVRAIRDQLGKFAIPSARVIVRGYGFQGAASKQFSLVFSPTRN